MFRNDRKFAILKTVYFLFFVTAAVLAYISSPPVNMLTTLIKVGQIFGIWTLTAVSIQVILATRATWIERGIGHDRIMNLHKLNGKLLTVAVLLHPLFVNSPMVVNKIPLFEYLSNYTLYHWIGITAFSLIFFTVILTLYADKLGLKYEVWRKIHLVAYVIVFLGFFHSFILGSDLVTTTPLLYWWYFLAILVVTAIGYRYLIRPREKITEYSVSEIRRETKDVRTIHFKPKHGKPFTYAPGQFAFVRLYSEGIPTEEHHFTLSSAPNQDTLSFSVKAVGDYTTALASLKVGDVAYLEGPYGAFTNQGMTGPFVFIAGGIGITPLISMIRAMHTSQNHQTTTLLYAVRTEQDIVFRKELDEIANQGWLKVVYVLSDEQRNGFEHGRISGDLITKYVADPLASTYFLVGPPPMMNAVTEILTQSLGVNRDKILTERFALR